MHLASGTNGLILVQMADISMHHFTNAAETHHVTSE